MNYTTTKGSIGQELISSATTQLHHGTIASYAQLHLLDSLALPLEKENFLSLSRMLFNKIIFS